MRFYELSFSRATLAGIMGVGMLLGFPTATYSQKKEGTSTAQHTVVNFIVRDRDKRLVTDLPAGAIRVFTRKKKSKTWSERAIREQYNAANRPSRIASVLDISSSVSSVGNIPYAKAILMRFLRDAVGPEDKTILISFESEVYFEDEGCMQFIVRDTRLVESEKLANFRARCSGLWTNDTNGIRKIIEGLKARGTTDLYGALFASAASFLLLGDEGPLPPAWAVILVTDGQHFTLRSSLAERLRAEEVMRNSGALVYVVYTGNPSGLGSRANPRATDDHGEEAGTFLKRLAESTGGKFYRELSEKNFETAFKEIAAELGAVFTVAFYAETDDEEVRIVIDPGHKTDPKDPKSDDYMLRYARVK